MKLITKEIERELEKHGSENMKPIFKLFNPCGAQTWLITGREKDNHDILWGFADLGFGCVEFGTISLPELLGLQLPLGLSIERDLHFKHEEGTNYLELNSLAGI